jgi:hypothetical protein
MPRTYRSTQITLVENSTAGNPPKIFAGQMVEIADEPDTVKIGVDGYISTASHPSIVLWRGGAAKDFANITDVTIVDSDGAVLVCGELNKTFVVPRNVTGGVEFAVLLGR